MKTPYNPNDPQQVLTFDRVEFTAAIFNLAIFGLYVASLLFVMIKIRGSQSVDQSAWVTLSVYSVSILCRGITWILYFKTGKVPEDESVGNVLAVEADFAASIMIWLVLYYFIFEMRIVQDKLQSETPMEYRFKRHVTLRSRLAVLSTAAVLMSIIFILSMIFNIGLDTDPDLDAPSLWSCILDYICRVLKVLIDIYMVTTFIDLQTFFIKEKAEQLAEKDKEFTCFNKFIIIWTITLVVLNFLHSLTNLAYNPLFKYHTVLSIIFEYYVFTEVYAMIFVPLVDFLTVATLLYLFYFQGQHASKK
jgi:hypothetical protein